MAKIKFGMMMTDASGKLGGQVFAKNRGGSYVRTKATPLNPQTSSQMTIRGIFASISSAWSSLAESSRLSFNNFVADYARTDIFGDLRNPSGKALFQRLNQNLVLTNQPQITVCVAPEVVPFANLDTVNGNVGDTKLIVSAIGNTTGSKIMIWATPSLSQGKSFVKNDLRLIDVIDGADTLYSNIWAAYSDKFGAPTAGANIHVGVRVVNANGQASPLEVKKATIEA